MIQILIVDDEKPICDLIQMSLTRAGYHCTCVYDGLAAADILERNVFDLILLDVMLPNADGFELMEYIRPLGIPVIFLTARGSVDDRVRGLRMGAEDYIVKPFEVVELLARVDVVLRRYNKTDAVIEIGGLRIDTRADPLCGAMATAGMFHDMMGGLQYIWKTENLNKMNKATPVYFMAGDGDPVGNYGEGVKKVYNRFLKVGCKDVKLKLYKDGRHEMLNELNKDEVYADILDWLNSKI